MTSTFSKMSLDKGRAYRFFPVMFICFLWKFSTTLKLNARAKFPNETVINDKPEIWNSLWLHDHRNFRISLCLCVQFARLENNHLHGKCHCHSQRPSIHSHSCIIMLPQPINFTTNVIFQFTFSVVWNETTFTSIICNYNVCGGKSIQIGVRRISVLPYRMAFCVRYEHEHSSNSLQHNIILNIMCNRWMSTLIPLYSIESA